MVQDSDEKCKLRVDRAAHAGWVPTSTQRTALPYGGSNTRGLLSVSPPGKIKDELCKYFFFPQNCTRRQEFSENL